MKTQSMNIVPETQVVADLDNKVIRNIVLFQEIHVLLFSIDPHMNDIIQYNFAQTNWPMQQQLH